MRLGGKLLAGYVALALLGIGAATAALLARGPVPAALGVAAIVAATCVLAFTTHQRIVIPMRAAVASVRRAAEGHFDQPCTHAGEGDEVRDLGRWLNHTYDMWGHLSRASSEKEALRSELDVARQIQTSMLPRKLTAEGLDVAARSLAAEEVGGDYYDVLPTKDGAWIGIGDVAGHGLPAGLIMLTVQSAISALTKVHKDGTPKDVLGPLNEVIYYNVKERLNVSDYVTLSLMRFYRDGRLVIAGAHEETIVYRADSGTCESFPTEGTWIGVIDDIREHTTEATYQLRHGDVVLVFTDGITEACNETDEPFGFERLMAEVQAVGTQPVSRIADHIVARVTSFAAKLNDDLSVLVFRYQSPGRPRMSTTFSSMPVVALPGEATGEAKPPDDTRSRAAPPEVPSLVGPTKA